MTLADALRLGRVSNLPTVWSNALTGAVLAGGGLADARLAPVLVAMTLFYVGGMYLNDYYDADVDAIERPERPIPAGRVRRAFVGRAGFAMLALGIGLMAALPLAGAAGPWPVIAALALAAAVVAYDRHHKDNPASPVLMGLCRVLVYLCAGLAFAAPPPATLAAAAVVLLCYLIGLTYVAKQENLGAIENLWPLALLCVPVAYGIAGAIRTPATWPFLAAFVAWALVALRYLRRREPGDVPRAVVSLIAGISLLDAVIVAAAGASAVAALAVAAFALTLALQRHVPGT